MKYSKVTMTLKLSYDDAAMLRRLAKAFGISEKETALRCIQNSFDIVKDALDKQQKDMFHENTRKDNEVGEGTPGHGLGNSPDPL